MRIATPILAIGMMAAARLASAAEIDFVSQIAPLLQKHCLACHGVDDPKGGLRLNERDAFLEGGDSGRIVQIGESTESELIRRVRSADATERMPQGGAALTDHDIALLSAWINSGAPWPDGFVVDPPEDERRTIVESHWAFQPVVRPAVPDVEDRGIINGIDAFIRDRLQDEGLTPAPPADRVTLIRRVTLDLIGLPPSVDEVDAFINDSSPDAYDRLVDRLLSSPHYGEQWARPWLDLCHYADTDGYLTDQLRPVAWRYRQWLVDALNQNLPFDQFTIQQIAGDLLPEATLQERLATGFLRQTLSNREGGADLEEFRVNQVVDRTQMVGTIWLGMTVGCARCHDHKYDPVSQREFYKLYAFLNNADEVNIDAPLPDEAAAYVASRSEYRQRRRELLVPLQKRIDELQHQWEQKLLHAWRNPGDDHVWDRQWELLGLVWGGGLGEGQLEGTEIVKLDWADRSPRQQADLLDYFLKSGSIVDPEQFSQMNLAGLHSRLEELKAEFPPATRAPVMQTALNPRQTWLHVRGEFRDRGPDVEPATPNWLHDIDRSEHAPRLALARWIVARDNPLTARVTVNRMWQEFFGRGLVTTPEDFGTRGSPPSHPQLLNWLACEFMDSGWDVKEMHRMIVSSATYQQSSALQDSHPERDPENVWLARQSSLRVTSEVVRDQGLAVSGLLCRTIGGPSVKPPQPERVTMEAFGINDWQISPPPDRYRRSIYTFVIRTAPFAQSIIFDAPNPNEICTRRIRSNTPLQALTLLNDPMFFEMASAMASLVLQAPVDSDAARIEYAFRRALARPPESEESDRLLVYLSDQRAYFAYNRTAAEDMIDIDASQESQIEVAAWTNLCSVLLNLHEFITRD